MKRGRFQLGPSQSAAVYVRVVAFVVAVASVIAIPATLIAAAAGQVATLPALYAMGCAAGLILLAALTVRSFDPLRD